MTLGKVRSETSYWRRCPRVTVLYLVFFCFWLKKVRHPCKYDLYDIFCAILYLVKEGCTWRGIPHDFPKWENVRYHYDNWTKMGKLRWIECCANWWKQNEKARSAMKKQRW